MLVLSDLWYLSFFSTAKTTLEVQLSYKDAEIEMLRARVQELEGQVHCQQQSPMAQ